MAQYFIFPPSHSPDRWISKFNQLRQKLAPLKNEGDDQHQFHYWYCQFLRAGRTSGDAAALWRFAATHFFREKVYANFAVFSLLYQNVFINMLLLTPAHVKFLNELEWLWGGNEEAFNPRYLKKDLLLFQSFLYLAETYTRDILVHTEKIHRYQNLSTHPQNDFGLHYLNEHLRTACQDAHLASTNLRHCLLQLEVQLPNLGPE